MFLGQDGHLLQASPAWSLDAWTDFHCFLPPQETYFWALFFMLPADPGGGKKRGPFL